MRAAAITLLICLVVLISGCNRQSTNEPAPASSPSTPVTNSSSAVKPTVDACTVLTSDEIKAVQGEAVKETVPSNRTGDFIVSQCYYALPTASNSVSVTLTERNPENNGGQSVKDFWENTFGKDEKKSGREPKKEREEEKKKPEAKREGEEEEGAQMEPVGGVGDEAFWSASPVGGALYVLMRDRYLRISVGGAGNAETKLKKSKTLALKAVSRL